VASRDQIQNALTAGEVIKVVYHSGSQPGTVRNIAPFDITGNKVRAQCFTSKALKTFLLEKIEFVGDENTEIASEGTPLNQLNTCCVQLPFQP